MLHMWALSKGLSPPGLSLDKDLEGDASRAPLGARALYNRGVAEWEAGGGSHRYWVWVNTIEESHGALGS